MPSNMSSNELAMQQDILLNCQHQQVSQLYNHHHSWLYSWLYKKLGCVYQAEDLSHDTFIKLLNKQIQPNLREPRAYLTTIAHGLVVNHWRRRDIEKTYLDTLAALPDPEMLSAEAHSIVIETLMQIDMALNGLTAPVREAFLLSQLEGLTYKTIAMRLNVSERTIKNYMAQAMLHCLLVAESDA